MSNCVLRSKNVQEITGLSLSTLNRMEAAGLFPKRRKVGQNAVGWLKSEVDAWLDDLKIRIPTKKEGRS